MPFVSKFPLPDHALLSKYVDQPNAYTDCYGIDLPGPCDIHSYVRGFYTGRLFRVERWFIGAIVRYKSSDQQLDAMLAGQSDRFSAWTIEDRGEDQLLMCDYQKRTRSWFMVEPVKNGTRLYFGTAVVKTDYLNSKSEILAPYIFRMLLPFHKLYARLLLRGAIKSIRHSR